jgi:long-chain acyl-CoA synthetase
MKQNENYTLSQLCLYASAKYNKKTAFSMISDGKISGQITYAQLGNYAKRTASLLRQMGVRKGDRVLLLSENCPKWPLAYFGIALAGAVSVPLLTGFSTEQIHHIANHSSVRVICVSRSIAQKLNRDEFPQMPFLIIDDITETELSNFEMQEQNPDDLATVIYTSGTQGISKGVMLSGKNIISSALSSLTFVKLYPRDRVLSVLPLAHSYECTLGLIAPILSGASITYLDRPPSPSVLLPAVKIIRPTVMITVPLLIEKIYNNVIAPKLRESKLYKFSLTRPLAFRFAGRKLKSALGGRIRFFGIGGAPLCAAVENFLHRAGFPYSIGYGLTETSPLVAGNSPLRFSSGSGLIAPRGVDLRIDKSAANEGEIQVRGPNVMIGYYNDEEKTKDAFTSDGWLRTGDLGSLDKKGRLHIKGRLKALILGPSGENIYPEEIENLLGSSQLVEESLVCSGKKGELVAMVILSEAAKAAAGVIEHKLEELRAWVNKKLSVFSRLSKIEIRHEPFEKTATMKIKRYLYAQFQREQILSR